MEDDGDSLKDKFKGDETFQERVHKILEYFETQPIDGDPEAPYDGDIQSGDELRQEIVVCLERLSRDNSHESNQLVLKLLDAIPANLDDEFFAAVVKGATEAENDFLIVNARGVIDAVQEEIDGFIEELQEGVGSNAFDDPKGGHTLH